jgi:hypothetical protein
MSIYQGFRRQAVPQQAAQQVTALTIPAPTRGLVESENLAFMQPGAAVLQDNWLPTMRGAKLRGGCERWCVLPETTPIISSFEYISANVQKMFVGNATKLYDVTSSTAVAIKTGQASGNYVAAQMSNMSGDHMLVANEAGDYLLHFDGTTWTTFNTSQITTDPAVTPPPTCATGHNLTYVWKYRNRLFFIEGGSMNAWYLDIDAYQGVLKLVPLSGAASKGGKLIFGATWSLDAGDGTDEKCVFGTSEGELLIFTGTNPGDINNWRQEGRYYASAPMGMNAHMSVGGDLLLATVDGIIPISSAITKDATQLELAAITVNIKNTWRKEVAAKRTLPWTMKKWDDFGGIFVTWPGGNPGNRYCAIANIATGAWARCLGWDATCFLRMRGDMFFGTQDGIVMQADRTGYDDGKPYVATLVSGWGALQSRLAAVTWHQARATFVSGGREPFVPQLFACTDYVVAVPVAPAAGPDTSVEDVWDQGLWAPDMGGPPPPVPTQAQRDQYAQWDQPSDQTGAVYNTMWVSIGATGYVHALGVQVTVAQRAKPNVELIAVDAIFGPMGTNV